jgi:flagellar hook-associated protein 1 FlgK
MMGLNTAMKALQVYSYAIDTTVHNVANMSDSSYSRQLADITSSQPFSITGGQIGTGSQLSGVERIRDIYLDSQIMEAENKVGSESIINRTYQNLDAIFPEEDGTTSGLQTQITQFFTDWQNLATQSASGSASGILSAQNTLYQDATAMTSTLNSEAESLSNMRTDLTTDLKDDINKANNYIKQIYTLNGEIKQVYASGQSPNDLLDQRTAAMTSLSELINFTTQTSTDGTVTLIIDGNPLVSGATSYNLLTTVVPVTGNDPSALTLQSQDPNYPLLGITAAGGGGTGTVIPTAAVTGGEIAGILNSRDTIVQSYQTALDETANSLITVVNQVETSGKLVAGGAQATNFFTGTDAMNIGVDPTKSTPSNIAYSSNFSGSDYVSNDIASILGNLGNKLVSTFTYTTNIGLSSNQTLSLAGVTATAASPDTITINNSITVNYNSTTTVAGLVDAINTAGGGTVSAVFNDSTKSLWIFSSQGLNITDTKSTTEASVLLSKWGLKEEQWSAANVDYPYSSNAGVNLTSASWLNQEYKLNTMPTSSGQVALTTNGTETVTNWNNGDWIKMDGMAIMSSFPNGYATTQAAGQKFVLGNQPASQLSTNVVQSFQVTDLKGNFTQALNLVGNVTFDDIYQSNMDKLSTDSTTASNMLTQYQDSLTQLQTMQKQVTQVNSDNEEAQAAIYQRGYDAAVRLENVIDQMLNTLINNTGTSSTSSTTSN